MDDFAFSIIIPARGCGELLRRCIASIPDRQDIQTIIVDDNSDPSEVDFSDYPGLGLPRTEIIFDKSGKGAGHARNLGLQKALGRWLLFADADDTFITDGLCTAMDGHRDSASDIVFLNSLRMEEETGRIVREQLDKARYGRNPARFTDRLRYRSFAPWGKFIRRSLVEDNGLMFSEVPFGNDLFFSTLTGYYAKEVSVDFTPIYIWHIRTGGNLSSKHDLTAAQTKLEQECLRNGFLRSKGLKRHCTNLFVESCDKFERAGMGHREAVKHISSFLSAEERPGQYLYYLAYRLKKWAGL